MSKRRNTSSVYVKPVPAEPRPTHAFTAVTHNGGYYIGRADEGTAGYTLMEAEGRFQTYGDAKSRAIFLNQNLGLTHTDALKIVASTIGNGRADIEAVRRAAGEALKTETLARIGDATAPRLLRFAVTVVMSIVDDGRNSEAEFQSMVEDEVE
jgi:hypothetical protein